MAEVFRQKTPPDRYTTSVFVNHSTKSIWKSSQGQYNRIQRLFQGADVETGAQLSVIRMRKAKAYSQYHGIPFRLKPSSVQLKFGNGGFPSDGTFMVRTPTPDGPFISVKMNVVSVDIPILHSLEVMDREKLVANNVLNELQSYKHG